MEKCLRDSGFDKRNGHDVVFVGCSARFPFVEKLFQEFFFGKEPNRSINSDEVVSLVQQCTLPSMRSRTILSAMVLSTSKP